MPRCMLAMAPEMMLGMALATSATCCLLDEPMLASSSAAGGQAEVRVLCGMSVRCVKHVHVEPSMLA